MIDFFMQADDIFRFYALSLILVKNRKKYISGGLDIMHYYIFIYLGTHANISAS